MNDDHHMLKADAQTLLSTYERGAGYALLAADLRTCEELAQAHLAQDPYSSVCYALLALAARQGERWLEAAEMSRLAVCFGAREPRVLSLLAGCYELVSHDQATAWFREEYGALPERLNARIPQPEVDAIRQALSRPPRFPRRSSAHATSPLTVARSALSGQRSVDLPSWLEATNALELFINEGLGDPPDWITSTNDWANELSLEHGEVPDWVERPPSIEEVLRLSAGDCSVVEASPVSPPNSVSSSPPLPPPLPSSLPMPSQSSSSPVPSFTSALDVATRLGLPPSLKIALEVRRVQLIQGGSSASRELSGPLLLCQDESRLILIAYEGDQPRQKPWAFTPQHLLSSSVKSEMLELTLQGERQILIELMLKRDEGRSSLLNALSSQLESWRLG